jgi:hypothetical protein
MLRKLKEAKRVVARCEHKAMALFRSAMKSEHAFG